MQNCRKYFDIKTTWKIFQGFVHPEEKFDYPPAGLNHFTAWLEEMWKVPAVKEYGLTPQQHMEFKRQMGESLTNYDFLI